MALLEVIDLEKTYLISRAFRSPLEVKALRGVSLELKAGETLAVVGESGCGKSTLAKVLMKIETVTSGKVEVDGQLLNQISPQELSHRVQMIFQDPYSSINPRKKIFDIVAEPLRIGGESSAEIQKRVQEAAQVVGLRPEILQRYPHMLSGGQRQRVGIARALVTQPKVLICDEPVSALDVSVQAQVLNLLLDLQQNQGLSYLFISHDLGVVRFLAHRVAVMYLGRIVELAKRDDIFLSAKHPYTQLLLRSTPTLQPLAAPIDIQEGELPSPMNPPTGCAFHSRCPWATSECKEQMPELRWIGENQVACHHAEKNL